MYHFMSWANPSFACEDTKCISTCVEQNLPCQRGYKMHLNMCWPNSSHASGDTKCISTCVANPNYASEDSNWVEQTCPMPARTENESQLVVLKHFPCQRRQNLSHDVLTKSLPKCISTWVDQTHPMTERTQNVFQHVWTKPIPCLRKTKMYRNLCWSN